MPEPVHGLGRLQQHDPRSLNYPAPTGVSLSNVKWHRYGAVLDQGSLGSCTGNAGTHAMNTYPNHEFGTVCGKEADAIDLYSAATVADGFPGSYPPDDTGSSGLAVAQVLKARGKINGYLHAFGLDHFLSAMMLGPVMVGTDWLDDMFSPDANGLVHPTGAVAGGHEYVGTGVDVTAKVIRFQNSWSSSWGKRGKFFMTFDDFGALLSRGGDAILLAT